MGFTFSRGYAVANYGNFFPCTSSFAPLKHCCGTGQRWWCQTSLSDKFVDGGGDLIARVAGYTCCCCQPAAAASHRSEIPSASAARTWAAITASWGRNALHAARCSSWVQQQPKREMGRPPALLPGRAAACRREAVARPRRANRAPKDAP